MNTLLLLAAFVFSQDRSAEIDFQNQLDSLRRVAHLQAKSTEAARASALAMTLTAMNDGVEVGGEVLRVIDARGLEPKALVTAAAPNYPRVLGPQLARRAAAEEFSSMPDCAEKEYMIQSWETRVWLELGGDAGTLPVIEPLIGYAEPAVAARHALWLTKGRELALDKIGRATGKKTIPELEAEADSERRRAELAEANKRFTDFLLAESYWLRVNSHVASVK